MTRILAEATAVDEVAAVATALQPASKGMPLEKHVLNADVAAPVTPAVFRACWWLISLYHIINGVFVLAIGAVQLYISIPAVHANLWLIQIDRSIMVVAGWTMTAIAIVHLLTLFVHIVQPLMRCHLSFGHEKRPSRTSHRTRSRPWWDAVLKPFMWAVKFFQDYFGERGVFGVYGDYFYVGFYARQALEILIQTIQADQLSRSVKSAVVNRLVVVAIVVNCAFPPLLNYMLRRQPATRRMALLTMDILVDFAIMVIVPVLVILPRAREYDWTLRKYNESLISDDVWLTNAVVEARFAMISTWMDLVSTVFPHVSNLVMLDTLKGLIHRTSSDQRHVVSGGASSMRLNKSQTDTIAMTKRKTFERRATSCFYCFAIAWAMFVLVCHATANMNMSTPESCKLRIDAWLTKNTTCSVVNVNCHQLNIFGHADELTAELSYLERSTVKYFIFSHCPALHMPPTLTEFSNVLAVEFFNCTVVEWPVTAALTRHATPHVNQLHFLATDFVHFPAAILISELPSGLSILFNRGNLSELPDRFGDEWSTHVWPFFSVQYTMVSSLPPSFAEIKSKQTSILGNPITTLADDALTSPYLETIQLSFSNITSLPPRIGDASKLTQLIAENTSIASVPTWVTGWLTMRAASSVAYVVSFKGSPLCDDVQYAKLCTDHSVTVGYPYELVKTMRPLY